MKLYHFTAGLALGLSAVLSTIAPSIGAECEWRSLKEVRGYCPEQYARDDIGEELVQKVRWRAFNEYFPLDIENTSEAVAWIRHHEELSRNRALRGEFLIVFREVDGKVVAEKTAAPDGPMELDLRQIVHGYRDKIAAAFPAVDLAPDSTAWADRVREILPSEDELMRAMKPKHFVTTSQECPVLEAIVADGLATEMPALKPKGEKMISLYLHGRTFEVFVEDPSGNALYVRAHERKIPLFAWADDTVSKLEKCWKPKEGG